MFRRQDAKDAPNAMILELGNQIQMLRAELLGQGKIAETCAHPATPVHAMPDAHDHTHTSSILTVSLLHFIVELFSLLGVFVMVLSAAGVLPIIIRDIIPAMLFSPTTHSDKSQRSMLLCRMQLARGIMLGMDFMVAADVIETLLHQIDIVKLLCIVAIRSWLGFERAKEVEHMTHEFDHLKHARSAISKEISEANHETIDEKIKAVFLRYDLNGDGHVCKDELLGALKRMDLKLSESDVLTILGKKDSVSLEEFTHIVRDMLPKDSQAPHTH